MIKMYGNVFGNRLKQLRKDKGYTQHELAKLLDVSASSIGMYEQGRREPENAILSRICQVLDTTTDYLIGFSSDTPAKNQDVNKVIDDFTNMLMSQQGLMFNGEPMTEQDREKIVIAIKSAAAIVIPNGGEK